MHRGGFIKENISDYFEGNVGESEINEKGVGKLNTRSYQWTSPPL